MTSQTYVTGSKKTLAMQRVLNRVARLIKTKKAKVAISTFSKGQSLINEKRPSKGQKFSNSGLKFTIFFNIQKRPNGNPGSELKATFNRTKILPHFCLNSFILFFIHAQFSDKSGEGGIKSQIIQIAC